jgi:hypothetical protein
VFDFSPGATCYQYQKIARRIRQAIIGSCFGYLREGVIQLCSRNPATQHMDVGVSTTGPGSNYGSLSTISTVCTNIESGTNAGARSFQHLLNGFGNKAGKDAVLTMSSLLLYRKNHQLIWLY